MKDNMFEYFAYGSNMTESQLHHQKVCPSAKCIGIAKLEDFKLDFTRRSEMPGEFGRADVVGDKGNVVWGVLYEIPIVEIPGLETKEAIGRPGKEDAYKQIPITVQVSKRDGSFSESKVKTYVVKSKDGTNLPTNQKYKGYIINGAKDHHIPKDYIAELEKNIILK